MPKNLQFPQKSFVPTPRKRKFYRYFIAKSLRFAFIYLKLVFNDLGHRNNFNTMTCICYSLSNILQLI